MRGNRTAKLLMLVGFEHLGPGETGLHQNLKQARVPTRLLYSAGELSQSQLGVKADLDRDDLEDLCLGWGFREGPHFLTAANPRLERLIPRRYDGVIRTPRRATTDGPPGDPIAEALVNFLNGDGTNRLPVAAKHATAGDLLVVAHMAIEEEMFVHAQKLFLEAGRRGDAGAFLDCAAMTALAIHPHNENLEPKDEPLRLLALRACHAALKFGADGGACGTREMAHVVQAIYSGDVGFQQGRPSATIEIG